MNEQQSANASAPVSVSQQRGFCRSPRGENHGLDSKPGDEWANEGDIHDTDRLRWLVLNFDEDQFFNMPEDFGMAREYIDELMLANAKLSEQPPSATPADTENT